MTERPALLYLSLAAALTAVVLAKPYAGGWNDGSRLATAEMLAEHDTWAIDGSVFVEPNGLGVYGGPLRELLMAKGTLDKLRIDGRYYSDKSPVPSLLMAGCYRAWLAVGGPRFADDPGPPILFLTLMTSGLAFVVCVRAAFGIGVGLGLEVGTAALLAVAACWGTLAVGYVMLSNTHIMFLAVSMVGIRLYLTAPRVGWRATAWLGSLAGAGYTLDLGVGAGVGVGMLAHGLVRFDEPLEDVGRGRPRLAAVGGPSPLAELQYRRHARAGQREPRVSGLARLAI